MRNSPLALIVVSGPALVLFAGFWLTRDIYRNLPVDLPPNGPISIALAGDVLMASPLDDASVGDAHFSAVRDIVRGAHFAAANLEMNLLGPEDMDRLASEREPVLTGLAGPRWPYGTDREVEMLRTLGFDAFALANDHAIDYGAFGGLATLRSLDRRGLLHAGTGLDLAKARAAVFVGNPTAGTSLSKKRLAFISVTTSPQTSSTATDAQVEVAGDLGLNAIGHRADRVSAPGTPHNRLESAAGRDVSEFVVDESKERAVLDEIRSAREVAEAVVVSIHAHEPSNTSDVPAEFIRRFARAAIDHGALIVIGHGPHRLRGLESYKDGVIFYSLGNFLYQLAGVDFRAANVSDSGDFARAMTGAEVGPDTSGTPPLDRSWWEGLVAMVTTDRGQLLTIRLIPLNLGIGKSQAEKGIPRRASGLRATEILNRLARLSDVPGGLDIEEENAYVRGISPNPKAR